VKVAGIYIRSRVSSAVVYDEKGNLLFRNLGDGANYHRAGKEGIIALVNRLLKEDKDIDCICIGVSGCDVEKNMRSLSIEMNKSFKDCIIYNNGVIALVGASGKALGSMDSVLIEADTGSVAVGVNRDSETLRVGGWGYLLGDEGGAFDIGRKALARAVLAYDKLEKNRLMDDITEALSLSDFSDVIDLYDLEDPVQYISELFPVVCHDSAADDILEEGASALASMVNLISERLDMGAEKVLYETGRVFEEEGYKKRFESKIDGFSIEEPKHKPEVGAAMLAMEKLTGRFEELD